MSSISYESDLVTCPLFTAISQICNALHCPDFIKCYASYNYGRLSSVALPLVGGGISSHVGKTCFLISFLFSVVLSFICSRFWFGIFERNTHNLTFKKKSDILNYGSLLGIECLALSLWRGGYWRNCHAFLVVCIRIE